MIFLDANVFLYAAGKPHPLREPCRTVLRRVEDGSLASNTSVEVVQELLHVLSRRGLVAEGLHLARTVMKLFPVVLPLTRTDLLDACNLLDRHSGLTPRDAVHVATMRAHGIDTLVSADVHFDRVAGIVRVDPTDVGRLD